MPRLFFNVRLRPVRDISLDTRRTYDEDEGIRDVIHETMVEKNVRFHGGKNVSHAYDVNNADSRTMFFVPIIIIIVSLLSRLQRVRAHVTSCRYENGTKWISWVTNGSTVHDAYAMTYDYVSSSSGRVWRQ